MSIARIFRQLLPLALMCTVGVAVSAERTLDHATLQRLSKLTPDASLALEAFPSGPTGTASFRLKRVPIYAPDAHIYLIGAGGARHEIPRSTRVFLRGYAADGSARVAMVLEADGSFVEGNGEGAEGAFALEARADASGTQTFSAKPLESTLPAPNAFEFRCGNEPINVTPHPANDLAAQLQQATSSASISTPPGTAASYRTATIAIDTDSLFMSRLFSNNTTTATNWIASMFNTMNTMYETDLQVQLLIGTTILRTSAASDPYGGLVQNMPSSTADLNLFGNYWRLNEASVPRSFAILLSGAIASSGGGCSAAGIAWIDEYCQKGFINGSNTVGSYSVTKVCTNIGIDPNGTFDARIVGHEIGHNFGADHTHCTDITTGNSRVATNTIDTCFNGEAGQGCYGGATSCPVGQTSGTIMSYCNNSGCGTQNQLHFHSTHINQVLLPDIAANTPSCLGAALPDEIFKNGFGG